MIERKYLVDTNALGFIGAQRRDAEFFRRHCRVTEEVAHEARYMARSGGLAGLAEAVTPAILEQLTKVMAKVPAGDTSLVDLYGNKGAADPLLIATALVLHEQEAESLLGDEWLIATRDGAVAAMAEEFGIATVTPKELAQLIDEASGADSGG